MYYLYSSKKKESWLLILVLTTWLINDIQTISIQSFRSFINLITTLKISKQERKEKKVVLINPTKHFQTENRNVSTRIFLFRYWRIRNRAMAGMTWRSRLRHSIPKAPVPARGWRFAKELIAWASYLRRHRHEDVRVPVCIGTFERGIEVFYLPTSLAGVKSFRTGLFSLFALHRESSLFLLFSVYKNNKVDF